MKIAKVRRYRELVRDSNFSCGPQSTKWGQVRCNETFQKVLQYCTPARYINKGIDSSLEEFADRLYHVINGLLARTD